MCAEVQLKPFLTQTLPLNRSTAGTRVLVLHMPLSPLPTHPSPPCPMHSTEVCASQWRSDCSTKHLQHLRASWESSNKRFSLRMQFMRAFLEIDWLCLSCSFLPRHRHSDPVPVAPGGATARYVAASGAVAACGATSVSVPSSDAINAPRGLCINDC